jgi:hypothetical protein
MRSGKRLMGSRMYWKMLEIRRQTDCKDFLVFLKIPMNYFKAVFCHWMSKKRGGETLKLLSTHVTHHEVELLLLCVYLSVPLTRSHFWR